jgi:GrpB-like predicted nucleotidyltransferase (UPF0157 family)
MSTENIWIAVPTYWSYPPNEVGEEISIFDHPSALDSEGTFAGTLECFRHLTVDFHVVIVVAVSHPDLSGKAHERVLSIARRFADNLSIYLISPENLHLINRHFKEEASRLRLALGNQIINIEYVGSTAIEGMDAKPIIDIIVAVESLNKARDLVQLVEALGYKCKKNDNVPERIFFIKGPSSNRTYHLSFTEPTSGYWKAHILFHDYLLKHTKAAEEYRRLKREYKII